MISSVTLTELDWRKTEKYNTLHFEMNCQHFETALLNYNIIMHFFPKLLTNGEGVWTYPSYCQVSIYNANLSLIKLNITPHSQQLKYNINIWRNSFELLVQILYLKIKLEKALACFACQPLVIWSCGLVLLPLSTDNSSFTII